MGGDCCKIMLLAILIICSFYILVKSDCFNTCTELPLVLGNREVFTYTNIASLRKSKKLTGRMIQTKGYYSENDGGSGKYNIRKRKNSDADDGGALIFLDNGNVAELVTDGSVNVRQFGAKGDNLADDTQKIQNAIYYIESKNGGTVFFPAGQYKVSDTLTVSHSFVRIKGSDKYKAVLRPTEDLIIEPKELNIKWTLEVNNNNKGKVSKLNGKVDAGAKQIVVDDATGVEPGMLVYIKGSFLTSPWTSDNRGNAVKGETNKVLSVAGNLVHLTKPISEDYAKTEDITVTFIMPLVGIEINGLGVSCPDNCPEDARQYKGFTVIGCEQAVITDCYGNGCGDCCFSSVSSLKTTMRNNVVKNAWSFNKGGKSIYGMGYGLRASGDSFTEIIDNQAEECRHCVEVTRNFDDKYPSHNVLVANNKFKSSVSAYGVMSTHGPAKDCVFENNIAEGPCSLVVRGERITVKNNVLKGKILNYYGRNNTYESNEIYGGMTFRQEDTVEDMNFNVIKENTFHIKSNELIYLIGETSAPFKKANGWVIKDNIIVIDNNKDYSNIYMFNTRYARSEKIDFGKGFVFKNNKARSITNKIIPIKMCSDMLRISL